MKFSSVRFIRGVVSHAACVSVMSGLLPLRVRFLPGPGDVDGGDDVDVDVVVNWDSEDCGRVAEREEDEEDEKDASVVRSTRVLGIIMLDPCQKLIQGDLVA